MPAPGRSGAVVLLLLAAWAATGTAAAADLERLVVRDLERRSVEAASAEMLTDLLASCLRETGRYRIPTRAEIRAALERAGRLREFGRNCVKEKCILEFGNAVGADLVLAGSVAQASGTFTVALALYDTRTGKKQIGRSWECACPEGKLAVRVPEYVREMMALETPAQREAREAREAEETRRKAEELRRTLERELVPIPGGEFLMGGGFASQGERPVHLVRLDAFRLAKSEVTQGQWRTVMGYDAARFSRCEDCPVEMVSWEEAQEFIRKATDMTGLPLRLPTEAEWEYAARGGSRQQRWSGTSTLGELGECSWNAGNSGQRTQPVCQKRANDFGLCDMSGNVWEWVSDWFSATYYAESPTDNPTGPASGTSRVFRGGGFDGNEWVVLTMIRTKAPPEYRNYNVGFRLAAAPVRR